VKIVLVAETFLPEMNGVVNSVLQMLRHFHDQGHETLVIAPRSPDGAPIDEHLHGADSALLRSAALPSYPGVRLTFATAGRLESIMREFNPDVVHLASPFILGWQALRAAEHLGIPTVAIYQTDIPGYAQRYGIPAAAAMFSKHVSRIHRRASLTLAPSSSAMAELTSLGVDRLALWARGVDGVRFRPHVRSESLRHSLAPLGEKLIGYVGRLAPEKQVEDLMAVSGIAGTKLVIVGDGPSRPALEKLLPDAVFLGFQSGDDLAQMVASFDVFVHPGENETFCQTVQEALASGVPVVATGRGGPLDLVKNSQTGWLYKPGDLDDLRGRVMDLLGDDSKRMAFGRAARASVAHRTWSSLGDELLGHYESVVSVTARERTPAHVSWQRFVAVGDSLTEGLSDTSRQAAGVYRGWADRLAGFLAHGDGRELPLRYANLAVRSRKIADVVENQIPRAIGLNADFATVLVGANDLVRWNARPKALARELAAGVASLRTSGADVLVITAFAPRKRSLRLLNRRFSRFNDELIQCLELTGAMIVDFASDPACAEKQSWAEDRVHLSSYGHRVLSYRAAARLGVARAAELGILDNAIHTEPPGELDASIPTARWLWEYVLPWVGRRLSGRTAGDGILAKQPELLAVNPRVPTVTQDDGLWRAKENAATQAPQRVARLKEPSLVDSDTQ
jgi:phosphatidylinositol alpha 1,6-mannosyltransferase